MKKVKKVFAYFCLFSSMISLASCGEAKKQENNDNIVISDIRQNIDGNVIGKISGFTDSSSLEVTAGDGKYYPVNPTALTGYYVLFAYDGNSNKVGAYETGKSLEISVREKETNTCLQSKDSNVIDFTAKQTSKQEKITKISHSSQMLTGDLEMAVNADVASLYESHLSYGFGYDKASKKIKFLQEAYKSADAAVDNQVVIHYETTVSNYISNFEYAYLTSDYLDTNGVIDDAKVSEHSNFGTLSYSAFTSNEVTFDANKILYDNSVFLCVREKGDSTTLPSKEEVIKIEKPNLYLAYSTTMEYLDPTNMEDDWYVYGANTNPDIQLMFCGLSIQHNYDSSIFYEIVDSEHDTDWSNISVSIKDEAGFGSISNFNSKVAGKYLITFTFNYEDTPVSAVVKVKIA